MSTLLTTVFNDGVVRTGTLFDCPDCCKDMHTGKCAAFYRKMFKDNMLGDFVKCPFGLVACKISTFTGEAIITGLRIKKISPKGKSYGENIFLPSIADSAARRLIKQNKELIEEEMDASVREKFVPNLVHSLSKILDVGQSRCEYLLRNIKDDDVFADTILSLVNAIMSARVIFNADDVRAHSAEFQSTSEMNVHGKFLKMAKLFTHYEGVHVNYQLSGEVCYRYRLMTSFECIPYLLLENIRKYAPSPKKAEVLFCENNDGLTIRIRNIGPLVLKSELGQIMDYGVRGKWAEKYTNEGAGIGLNTVRTIASSNNIHFDVSDEPAGCELEGIPQGEFVAMLQIPISLRASLMPSILSNENNYTDVENGAAES